MVSCAHHTVMNCSANSLSPSMLAITCNRIPYPNMSQGLIYIWREPKGAKKFPYMELIGDTVTSLLILVIEVHRVGCVGKPEYMKQDKHVKVCCCTGAAATVAQNRVFTKEESLKELKAELARCQTLLNSLSFEERAKSARDAEKHLSNYDIGVQQYIRKICVKTLPQLDEKWKPAKGRCPTIEEWSHLIRKDGLDLQSIARK